MDNTNASKSGRPTIRYFCRGLVGRRAVPKLASTDQSQKKMPSKWDSISWMFLLALAALYVAILHNTDSHFLLFCNSCDSSQLMQLKQLKATQHNWSTYPTHRSVSTSPEMPLFIWNMPRLPVALDSLFQATALTQFRRLLKIYQR